MEQTKQTNGITKFLSPQTVVGRFVFKRTIRSAVLWSLIFAIYTATKSLGFVKAYPTAASRVTLTHSLGNNIGLNAILGTPHQLATPAGWTAWNVFGVITLIGAIWGLLLATKYFRGEEENGRSEILLSGQSTQKTLAINILAALGAAWLLVLVLVSVLFIIIGYTPSLSFTTSNSAYFALCTVASIAMFMSIGALTSQIMPTRTRSSTLGVGLFGIFFVIRAMADTTGSHWLLNVTPLGWIEKLAPLAGSNFIWLLPIAALTGLCVWSSVYLAGRRDLGSSLLADKDSGRARLSLLTSPFKSAVRLTRASTIGWMIAILAFATFYGLITKSAINALGTRTFQKGITKIVHSNRIDFATLFMGIIFFLVMVVIMGYAASAMSKVREDEAQGYLDNLLVRRVSRNQWLVGRTTLILLTILLASLLSSVGVWLGTLHQHVGVAYGTLLDSGLNAAIPAVLVLGVGALVLGVWPRLTSLAVYATLAWSFLIDIVGSGVKLNHWLIDTSIFTHVNFAPATKPDWLRSAIVVLIALALATVGFARFNNRDLASE